MIVVMAEQASEEEIEAVQRIVDEAGFQTHRSADRAGTALGVLGEGSKEGVAALVIGMPGVARIMPVDVPYILASTEGRHEPTTVEIRGVPVGGGHFAVIAGPCSVEDETQILETARGVKAAGARLLRGGAFKPRSSPYSFQGLGEAGLRLLARAREETGLGIVTEVMDPRDVERVGGVADALQIGARNMQNFALLREVGRAGLPVVLKRGPSATYAEWLMAAEYVLSEGNPDVIFCERGIRTFETHTRHTMDIAAIPALHELSHLPVIADPSHGTGRWRMVAPLARAAVAAGADGLLIEVHPRPREAWSDASQTLSIEHFADLMASLEGLHPVARTDP